MPTVKQKRQINEPETTYQAENVTGLKCVTFCHILSHSSYEEVYDRFFKKQGSVTSSQPMFLISAEKAEPIEGAVW